MNNFLNLTLAAATGYLAFSPHPSHVLAGVVGAAVVLKLAIGLEKWGKKFDHETLMAMGRTHSNNLNAYSGAPTPPSN